MIRFLIRFLLIIIVLVVGGALLAQWRLEQKLDEFAKGVQPFVELEYDSASLSYTGEVKVNAISAYIQMADYTVEIGEVAFSVGSLMDLIMLDANMENRELPDSAYLKVKGLLLPFNSKMLNAFKRKNTPSTWDMIDT